MAQEFEGQLNSHEVGTTDLVGRIDMFSRALQEREDEMLADVIHYRRGGYIWHQIPELLCLRFSQQLLEAIKTDASSVLIHATVQTVDRGYNGVATRLDIGGEQNG